MRMKNKKQGFTLVELLVVIGIIALLVSILLPALNRARAAAQNTVCLSNLRSIGQGMHLYTNDHKGRLPAMNIAQKPTYLRTAGASKYSPGTTADVRPMLENYIPYNLLQCPLSKELDLEQVPGSAQIETSYAYYADWTWLDAGNPAGVKNKKFSHVGGYFNYHPNASTVFEFNVLAGDFDFDVRNLNNNWESSHPTENSGQEYSENPSNFASRFVHIGGPSKTPRAPMSRNLLFNDGSVVSYGEQKWDYNGDPLWARVPAFDNRGFGLWTYLPRRDLR